MLLLTRGSLHNTRCLVICPVRVWVCLRVWVWAWMCVAPCVGQGGSVGRAPTLLDFPIAAEENFYAFHPDGTYTFSYDTGGGKHQSFRIEMRDASGRVSGRFGYIDPAGALHITEYQADSAGYRASVEVYHKVSLAPPVPLLVGPLPKRPASTPQPPEDPPQPPSMRPVGPAPFFPPPHPILIIGPLPKPLQPKDSAPDDDTSDLGDEDTLFTVPSDPQVPSVLPLSPLGNTPPMDTLSTPASDDVVSLLQGSLTEILREASGDDAATTNSTLTAPDVLTEDSSEAEFKEPATGVPGQAGAQTTAITNHRLPESPQSQPTKDTDTKTIKNSDSDATTQEDYYKINPTKTNSEKGTENSEPLSLHMTEDSDSDSVNDSVRVKHKKYFPDNDSLLPSATTATTTSTSRLAQRGIQRATPTVTSTSPVSPSTQQYTTTHSRTPQPHHPPPPPPPPLTYLPVGSDRLLYPTAPLLQLPQESKSY